MEDYYNELVFSHQWLVRHIAKEYIGRGLDYHDLISEGNLGLMRAADKFDPDKGSSFAHCAKPWVRGAIKRALRRMHSVEIFDEETFPPPVRDEEAISWLNSALNGQDPI